MILPSLLRHPRKARAAAKPPTEASVAFADKLVIGSDVHYESEYPTLESQGKEIPESISVILIFSDGFSCEHNEENLTEEQRLAHNDEKHEYYTTTNSAFMEELGLKDYDSVSVSQFGPRIELKYSTYDAFLEGDYQILATKNPTQLIKIWITGYYPIVDI